VTGEIVTKHKTRVRKTQLGPAANEPSFRANSGTLMHRQFCPSCGTPLFTQAGTRRHYIGVRAGSLDDPDLGKPQITIWTSSAPSWACFDPALPREEKQAPSGK